MFLCGFLESFVFLYEIPHFTTGVRCLLWCNICCPTWTEKRRSQCCTQWLQKWPSHSILTVNNQQVNPIFVAQSCFVRPFWRPLLCETSDNFRRKPRSWQFKRCRTSCKHVFFESKICRFDLWKKSDFSSSFLKIPELTPKKEWLN